MINSNDACKAAFNRYGPSFVHPYKDVTASESSAPAHSPQSKVQLTPVAPFKCWWNTAGGGA